MANSSWFVEAYYLQAKADQLNAAAYRGITTWTVASVQAEFNAVGVTAQNHYLSWGWKEGLAPNAYYNESQYCASKVAALNAASYQGRTNWTVAEFQDMLNGSNPFLHYQQYGAFEAGVNPSTGFSDSAYLIAKAAQMNATSYQGRTNWTSAEVNTLLQTAGMSPIAHYLAYGITEGLTTTYGFVPTSSSPGVTYTLTTGIDVINGGGGNDFIIGDFTATTTLNAGDQLNGGAGTNVLKAYGTYAAANMPVNITNIQEVQFANTAAGNIDLSGWTKATTGIELVSFADASALTGNTVTTTAGQALSLSTGATNKATAGAVTWAASATDTSSKLTLNGYQGGTGVTPDALTITGAAITTQNLVSSGAANKVSTLTLGAVTDKLVITGDKKISTTTDTVSSGGATVLKTVDASASTGGVSLVLAAATNAAFAFTGGSGDDALKFANNGLGSLTAGSQLDGGTGTDKIGLLDVAMTAAEYTAINTAKNFDVVGLNAAITFDASQLTSIKKFSLDTNAAQTINKVQTGSTVDVTAAHGTAITLAGDVGVTAVNFNIGTSTTAGIALGTVTSGLTTMAVTTNGTNAAANSWTLANADNSSITITGSNALTFSAALLATTTGSKVDGSAMTGKLTVLGNTTAFSAGTPLGDILIGGSAADTITAAINGGILTGNGGADTFDVSVALGGTSATYQTTRITDVAAGDKITFGATAGAFTTTAVDLSSATTEGQALDLLAAGSNTDLKWGVYSGNTYIVDDVAAAGTFSATDTMVKMTGIYNLVNSTLSGTTLTIV